MHPQLHHEPLLDTRSFSVSENVLTPPPLERELISLISLSLPYLVYLPCLQLPRQVTQTRLSTIAIDDSTLNWGRLSDASRVVSFVSRSVSDKLPFATHVSSSISLDPQGIQSVKTRETKLESSKHTRLSSDPPCPLRHDSSTISHAPPSDPSNAAVLVKSSIGVDFVDSIIRYSWSWEWAGEGSAVKRPAGDLEGQYTSNSASCSPRLNLLAAMACIIRLAACICGTAPMWLEYSSAHHDAQTVSAFSEPRRPYLQF